MQTGGVPDGISRDIVFKGCLKMIYILVTSPSFCDIIKKLYAKNTRCAETSLYASISIQANQTIRRKIVTDYQVIIKQTEALSEASKEPIPLMANVSALLFHSMEKLNWAGFYLVKNGVLLLGPFQGKVACVTIEKGRGVCGTAWAEDRLLNVPDVHAFPGHIACDSASNSEIVIPIHRKGEVIAVLDIDSPVFSRFDERDAEGLRELVRAMERIFEE